MTPQEQYEAGEAAGRVAREELTPVELAAAVARCRAVYDAFPLARGFVAGAAEPVERCGGCGHYSGPAGCACDAGEED